MTHEPMHSLVASERYTFSVLALLAAAVVALVLIAVTGVILLDPHPVHLPGPTRAMAMDALTLLILQV